MDPPHQNIRESRWNHRCKISESGRAWHAGMSKLTHTHTPHWTEMSQQSEDQSTNVLYITNSPKYWIPFRGKWSRLKQGHINLHWHDTPVRQISPNIGTSQHAEGQVSTSLSSKSFRFTCLLNSQASLTSSMWWWWHCRFVRTCQQSFKALFHKVLELSVSKRQSWRGWCIINNRIPFISHHGFCDHPPETSIWWNFPSQHWPFSSLQNLGGA